MTVTEFSRAQVAWRRDSDEMLPEQNAPTEAQLRLLAGEIKEINWQIGGQVPFCRSKLLKRIVKSAQFKSGT
jgi:hypothetical protein